MAESEGGGKPPHPLYPPVFILVIALVASALFASLQRVIYGNHSLLDAWLKFQMVLSGDMTFGQFLASLGNFSMFILFVKVFSFIVSIILIWLIFTTAKKLTRLNHILMKPLYPPEGVQVSEGSKTVPEVVRTNPRWDKVLKHTNSNNPSEWKLAILEADIILAEIIEKMGYHGETIGDKLKKVERSDFTTIDNAWEAHKVRNAIAHEGMDFVLSEREARRVIALYQTVFEEFRYI